MTEAAQIYLVTVAQLREVAFTAAREGARAILAEIPLPPYSQFIPYLPPECRRKDFLAAIAAGCPHRRRGRMLLVERTDWTLWITRRTAPIQIDADPKSGPPPANDAEPHKPLDIEALTQKALAPRARRR